MKLFYFTDEQMFKLQQLSMQVGRELLQTNFSDPAMDEKTIRRHAYLTGKFELLNELCADDYPEPETTPEGE